MAEEAFVARVNLRAKSELAQCLGAMDVLAAPPESCGSNAKCDILYYPNSLN